jgi:TolA-binding protein
VDYCEQHSAHAYALEHHDARLDAHSKDIDEMQTAIIKLTALEESSQKRLDEMERRTSELEKKPGDRWESIVTSAITSGATAIIAIIISNGIS